MRHERTVVAPPHSAQLTGVGDARAGRGCFGGLPWAAG